MFFPPFKSYKLKVKNYDEFMFALLNITVTKENYYLDMPKFTGKIFDDYFIISSGRFVSSRMTISVFGKFNQSKTELKITPKLNLFDTVLTFSGVLAGVLFYGVHNSYVPLVLFPFGIYLYAFAMFRMNYNSCFLSDLAVLANLRGTSQ